jgi:hypothetical protein
LDCLILHDGTYGLSLNVGYCHLTLRNIREERRPYVLICIQCNTLFMMRICSLTCQTSQLKHFPFRLYGNTYSLSDTLHTCREPPVSGIKLRHSSLWPVTFCPSFSSEKCELLCVMLLINFLYIFRKKHSLQRQTKFVFARFRAIHFFPQHFLKAI